MASAKVEGIVKGAAVAVFSKTYCPYCTRVKDLFKSLNVQNMKVVELDNTDDGAAMQQALKDMTGQSTVPNVWIGGNFIGGCDATTALHNKGQLKPKLEAAKAF